MWLQMFSRAGLLHVCVYHGAGLCPSTVQEGGGSPKQISPSAEEGGSRAATDPFNWCGFNYDNRLPELLLFRFR